MSLKFSRISEYGGKRSGQINLLPDFFPTILPLCDHSALYAYGVTLIYVGSRRRGHSERALDGEWQLQASSREVSTRFCELGNFLASRY